MFLLNSRSILKSCICKPTTALNLFICKACLECIIICICVFCGMATECHCGFCLEIKNTLSAFVSHKNVGYSPNLSLVLSVYYISDKGWAQLATCFSNGGCCCAQCWAPPHIEAASTYSFSSVFHQQGPKPIWSESVLVRYSTAYSEKCEGCAQCWACLAYLLKFGAHKALGTYCRCTVG